MSNLKFCFILPCYEEHAYKLEGTLKNLLNYQLQFIIVDDGSSPLFAEKIREISSRYNALLVVNAKNGGKGAAIKSGMLQAQKLAFSHAIQVDSDGQHDTSQIKKIIDESIKNPHALISARPVYDETVPKARLWGRYLTHVWVWIETLSFDIKDSMCGVRSYPVEITSKVIQKYHIGNRMDFDPEIMVRLYWENMQVIFIPIQVFYPEDGKSYFDTKNDNILITKMHTKLFFGMLFRFFKILNNKVKKKTWEERPEKGVTWLIKFTLFIYTLLGKKLTTLIVHFISFYYFLFSRQARKNSRHYYKVYSDYCLKKKIKPKKLSSYKHITNFALSIMDKFIVWKKELGPNDIDENDLQILRKIKETEKGAIFISSHYGNIEVSRSIGKRITEVNYNAIIYTKNSKKFYNILNSIDPEATNNIIAVESFGADVALKIEKRAKNGEWIFCMGDRKTVGSDRKQILKLLHREIHVSQGPFLLCYLIDVPVYAFHCYKENDRYRLKISRIDPDIERVRQNRESFLSELSWAYAKDLEELIIKDPGQWYNFYNYWD